MKPWAYNLLAVLAGAVFLALATGVLLLLVFTGSAFRMSNITQLKALSVANLQATIPLFIAVVVIMLGYVIISICWDLRGKG